MRLGSWDQRRVEVTRGRVRVDNGIGKGQTEHPAGEMAAGWPQGREDQTAQPLSPGVSPCATVPPPARTPYNLRHHQPRADTWPLGRDKGSLSGQCWVLFPDGKQEGHTIGHQGSWKPTLWRATQVPSRPGSLYWKIKLRLFLASWIPMPPTIV